MDIAIDIDLSDIETRHERALERLGRRLPYAVLACAEAGRDEALRMRKWKDRTGNAARKMIAQIVTRSYTYARAELVDAVPYASYLNDGTAPHEIRPRRKRWLAWEGDGGQGDWRFAKDHPGTTGDHYMDHAREEVDAASYREGDKLADEYAKDMGS